MYSPEDERSNRRHASEQSFMHLRCHIPNVTKNQSIVAVDFGGAATFVNKLDRLPPRMARRLH
jgi:hypothetical protein